MIVSLPELGPRCVGAAGSKAANLARLIKAGLPVPSGFCITTAAFRQFTAGLINQLPDGPTENLDPPSVERAKAAAARMRACLEALPMPPAVEARIVAAWQAQGPEKAYAVRSSATAEDLPDASFAGLQDTSLNVRGREALLRAVRRCWISLFTDRAVVYRNRNGIPHRSAAMAVLVQEMVVAQRAGVLFTADPLTGDGGRIVIEATYGLGEALVSGKVSPDRIVLDKDSLRVVECQINCKEVEIVPDRAGGVRESAVSAERQNLACLDDAFARRLGELARNAERLFGAPQDMEWAVSSGQVFLLQSRPITVLPPTAGEVDEDVWSNTNTGEVLPGVLTPMSWAVMKLAISGLLHPILRRFGIDPEERPWFSLIAGRAYMNMTTLAQILHGMPFLRGVAIEQVLGGQQGKLGLTSRSQPASRRGPLCLPTLLRLPVLMARFLAHATDRSCDRVVSEWRREVDQVIAADIVGMPDEELARFIPDLLSQLCGKAEDAAFVAAAVGSMGAGMGCAMAVFRVSRAWLGDEDGSVANRLISGAGGMDSAESALDLWRLAAWARQRPAIVQVLLEQNTFAAAHETLSSTPQGRKFLVRWQGFMAEHGHHARGEMDVHNPRWSETPDYVLDMIRVYLRISADADPLRLQAERLRQRQQLLADCRKRLRNPLKRWSFDYLVRKGQRGLAVRENCKSHAVRMVTTIRRALLESGRRLVQRGILPGAEDVFFLELEELKQLLTGGVTLDVAAILAQRKDEYQRNRALTPPPVIVGRFDAEDYRADPVDQNVAVLKGLAVSPGVVTGPARVILQTDGEQRVLPGEILVAPFTDPGWTPYFLPAAGIVMDLGGQLSHGSIVAREYGIPAVVNVGPATRIIRTGQSIRVDGNRGVVTILRADADAEGTI